MIYATDLDHQISIGSMSTRVTIRTKVVSGTNELDEPTGVTNTDTVVWGYVDNRVKPEDDLLNKQTNLDLRQVIIRYKNVTERDQVLIDGNVYDILRIMDMGRKRFTILDLKRIN